MNDKYLDLPDNFVCPKCGWDEFRDTGGCTEIGEAIYECINCGHIVYGMD